MKRKFIRKFNRFLEKFKKANTIIGIVAVAIIVAVIAVVLIVSSITKSNQYKELVKKVEELAIKYADINYPNVESNSSIILTLNDLIGERLTTNLENPYGSGYCDTSSVIEVKITDSNKEVDINLVCGSKKPNKINNPISLVKDEQFNEFVWSKKDIRIKINSGNKNIYSIISNGEVKVSDITALNNEIIINEQGVNYVKISSYNNEELIKTIYTPIYRIDKEAPVIELKEETILVDQGTIYEMPKCLATDNLTSKEDIACNIMGIVNTEKVDSYPLEYTAVDKAGNSTSKNITVVVKSPLLKDVLGTTNFTGVPTNNYVTFDYDTWRIMGHNGTNVKLVGPKTSTKSYDAKSYGYESYNTWLSDSRRSKSNASSLQRYLNGSFYSAISTRAKDMIATDVIEGGPVTTVSLSDWEICGGLNVTDSSWSESYTSGTFMSDNCYLKDEDNKYSYWTNTPFPGTIDRAWKVDANGSVSNNTVTNSFNVLPVLYLQSDVVVLGGTGTEEDPYIIGQ